MRIPNQPNPGDAAHQALIAKAHAMHSGQVSDQAPQEQKEDELIHTIDSSIQAAGAAVAELKQIQEEEEGMPADEEMAGQDRKKPMGSEETGSPSAQGWP